MIRKLFRQMSVTQTFSAMTTTLCLMIDSIVVGSLLGVDAMSAYGFSSPLLTIYVALGSLMINGVQVRLGQAMSRADRDASNDCYSTSIIMSLVLAAMCILLVFAAGNPLCALLGATTLMLSSIFYSEEDKTSLHALVKEMMIFTTEVTAAVVIIAEICSPWLLRLFLGSDPELISFAVPGLRLALLGVLPNMLSNIFKHYFLGIRKEKMTNLIAFLQGLGFNLPIVWALSRVGGLTGFWIGAVTAQAATFLAIVILCWRQYGGVSFSPAAFSFLKRDFGMNPDRFVTIAISDSPAAIAASKQLCDFCKQKGFDGATAMKIGLCVEEITMNILRHGFGRDKRAHHIEARLMLKEDRMLLRIRDDCFHFDPTKYLELHQNDDAAAHIGLRMVMRMVKEANYVNTLGLNNLTLVI